MKLTFVIIAFVFYGAFNFSEAFVSASSRLLDSKVQPKQVQLGKDSKDDVWGAAAFNHETHSLKNYNIEGTGIIACIECHHTDQPAPKPPLKTGERKVVLTTEALAAADAAPVKSCRSCHFQVDDGKPQPTLDDVELDNKEAYHRNCIGCHDAVKAKRPAANAPNKCDTCHVKKA